MWQIIQHFTRGVSHLQRMLGSLAVQQAATGHTVGCAGLDAYDASSGEHVLRACALPPSALSAASSFVCR